MIIHLVDKFAFNKYENFKVITYSQPRAGESAS